MSQGYNIGDLVWAKLDGRPWPGRVSKAPYNLVPAPETDAIVHCIYFFGTINYDWVEESDLKPFEKFKNRFIKLNRKVAFRLAISEIKDYIKHPEHFSYLDKRADFDDYDLEYNPCFSDSMMQGYDYPVEEGYDYPVEEWYDYPVEEGSPEDGKKEGEDAESSSKVKKSSKLKVKPAKRASSARIKTMLLKKKGILSCSYIYDTDMVNENPSTLNKSMATKLMLLPKPSGRFCPDPMPMDMDKVSEILLQKKVQASLIKFGFLGIGIMGGGLVKNLLDSGHQVVIWNRTAAKCKPFKKIGAKIAKTPRAVVKQAEIIFSCVADPQAAKEVVFGNSGVLQCPSIEKKGYVEMSSIDAESSRDIAEAINGKGGRYLEAQIQGSKLQAEEGTLIILTAGDRWLFDKCQSCFKAMSKHSLYFGSNIGSACKMNSILHVVGGVTLVALAEAMALADSAGLDQENLLEVLGETQLASPYLLLKGHTMNETYYTAHQPMSRLQKDLRLALAMGDSIEHTLPLTAAANEVYKHAKRTGYRQYDAASVYMRTRF